ncbi:MAG TPA: hypothetical protein VJB10_02045 [Candidatus Peribacteraceae bacterium]|nr:hypothetical protein [Candidatus Peribacteraceae bacterium]
MWLPRRAGAAEALDPVEAVRQPAGHPLLPVELLQQLVGEAEGAKRKPV